MAGKHSFAALILILLAFLSPIVMEAQKGVITTSVLDGDKPLDTIDVDFNSRYALVIGNAGYLNHYLKNPINDAQAIKNTLKQYGFKVIVATDLSEHQMDSIIKDFSDTIRINRAVGLFYFSGHGLQFNTQNFLLPISSRIENERDISKQTTRLNGILKGLAYSKKGMNIVILDACRTNPFIGNLKDILPGLSYNLEKTRNTLIFFATSANDVAEDGSGKNSPFTEALINTISQSDSIELMQIVKQVVRAVEAKTGEKQVPQYVGTLSEDFYFKKKINTKPRVFVLSVGISAYKNFPNLPFSAQGAKDFANVFKRSKGENYSLENIYLFIDKEATRRNVYGAIMGILKKAQPGDLVLMYYSGMVMVDNLLNTIYLPTSESELDNFEAIEQGQLLSILSKLPCKSLLFLDGYSSSNEAAQSTLLSELMKPSNGVVVFTAGSYRGYVEDGELRGSPFTHAITRGLEEAINPERGSVDVLSLSNFVKQKLLATSKLHPEVYFPLGWQNFTLPKLIPDK